MSLTERIKRRSLIDPESRKLASIIPPLNYSYFPVPGTGQYNAINKKRLWSNYGTFWDYLLRRDISILVESKIYDESGIELGKPQDYKLYKDSSKKSSDIMNAIWRVSHSHELHWLIDKNKNVDMVNFWLEVVELETIFDMQDISDIATISFWIANIIVEKYGKTNVITNPDYRNIAQFKAEGDLQIGTCVIDFKTSKYDPSKNLDYHLQIMGYASMARLGGYEINTVCFVNPLLGTIHELDISNWDKHEDVVEILRKL